MKIAICFSGQIRGDYERNIKNVVDCLPDADVFFTTWSNQPKFDWIHKYYDEPIMHYNPAIENANGFPDVYQKWLKTGKAKQEMWKHRTKQILGHALVVQDFADNYDVIVRARYDNITSKAMKHNMLYFCEKSYNEKKSLGFFMPRLANDPTPKLDRQPVNDQKFGLQPLNSSRRKQHHVDHMIIHRRDLFNTDYVWKLHNKKRLMVAEYGWWQVLSEPHGDNYEAYQGYVGLEYIKSKAYWENNGSK